MKNNQPLTEQRTLLLDYLSDKSLTKGCQASPIDCYVSVNGMMTFLKDDIFEVVHIDSKYEHTFTHKKVRGVITIDKRIFERDFKIIGKPVMIGDVLLKLSNLDVSNNYINKKESRYKIVDLWYENGFAKSLNDILDSEIISARDADCSNCLKKCEDCKLEVFKNPNVQSLHNFLWGVFKGEIINKKQIMNNYEKLRQKVNEILPERVEKFKNNDEIIHTKKCRCEKNELEVCHNNLVCECGCVLLGLNKKLIVKNLGKPLTILDVMAAYNKLGIPNQMLTIVDVGMIFIDRINPQIYCNFPETQVSLLSPLSTQEELCGELFKLFNNK